jgi:hypothetical protein
VYRKLAGKTPARLCLQTANTRCFGESGSAAAKSPDRAEALRGGVPTAHTNPKRQRGGSSLTLRVSREIPSNLVPRLRKTWEGPFKPVTPSGQTPKVADTVNRAYDTR